MFNFSSIVVLALVLISGSCAPQYARQVSYQINNSYTETRDKLTAYHRSQVKNFNLFQDRQTVGTTEIQPGAQASFSLTRWAPDIGTVPVYNSILTREGKGCAYVVTEQRNPGIVYDGPRALTGNSIGDLKGIDAWVVKNLRVSSRKIGEAKSAGPIYR